MIGLNHPQQPHIGFSGVSFQTQVSAYFADTEILRCRLPRQSIKQNYKQKAVSAIKKCCGFGPRQWAGGQMTRKKRLPLAMFNQKQRPGLWI
jgi:hypothetical protein